MRKIFLPFLIFQLITLTEIFSQAPSWIIYSERLKNYSEEQYFSSFISENLRPGDDEKTAAERIVSEAKTLLAESILVTIESNTSMKLSNVNSESNEMFTNNSSAYTKLDLTDLKEEKYYDTRKKIVYAFVYIKKTSIEKLYKNKINSLVIELKNRKVFAETLIAENQLEEAYKAYIECFPLLREIENARYVLFFAGNPDPGALQLNESQQLANEIRMAVSRIKNLQYTSPDDLCYFFAEVVKMQLPAKSGNILVSNFTYQDTKMASQLSRRLTRILEQKLANSGKLLVVHDGNKEKVNADYIIQGTYWDETDKLKVIAVVNELTSGGIIASAEGTLDKKWINTNNVAYKPENFSQAIENMQVMKQGEIVNGGLSIDLWTNRGQDNLLYAAGDTMELYLKSNKECYVRLIYYLASGEKVLLLDNYYIGSDLLNRIIKLPYQFVCDEPYGAEILQMNAQSSKFSPLKTRKDNGYEFIESSINEILNNLRGFKRVDDNSLNAEKRVIITTLKDLY